MKLFSRADEIVDSSVAQAIECNITAHKEGNIISKLFKMLSDNYGHGIGCWINYTKMAQAVFGQAGKERPYNGIGGKLNLNIMNRLITIILCFFTTCHYVSGQTTQQTELATKKLGTSNPLLISDFVFCDSSGQDETDFIERLMKYQPCLSDDIELDDTTNLVKSSKEYTYEKRGSYYIDKNITNNAYYDVVDFADGDSGYVPTFQYDCPKISIVNVMVCKSNRMVGDYRMEAHFIHAGNEMYVKDITVRQLVDYAAENGCQPFVRISDTDGNMIKGLLLLHNEILGYDHVVCFTADKSKIETNDLTFSARIILFFPSKNVKELILRRKLD